MKRPLRFWGAFRKALRPASVRDTFMRGYELGREHTEMKMSQEIKWAREDRALAESLATVRAYITQLETPDKGRRIH